MNGALAVPVAVVATALFAAAAAAVRHRATVRSSILGTAGTGGTRGTGMLRRGLGRAATTAAVWVGVALGGFAVAGPVGAIGGAAAVVVAPCGGVTSVPWRWRRSTTAWPKPWP